MLDDERLLMREAQRKVARSRKRQAKAATQSSVRQHEIAVLDSIPDTNLRFHSKVIIEKREDALAKAKNVIAYPSAEDLVYFVDGSALPRLETSAAAVVHMNTTKKGGFRWETTSFLVRQNEAVCADGAELAAIAGALVIAVSKIKGQAPKKRAASNTARRVLVFSDSQVALRQTLQWQHNAPCRNDLENSAIARGIITSSQILSQLDVHLVLHWVPGHARVKGNLRADKAARRMAKGRMGSSSFFEDYYSGALQGAEPSLEKDDILVMAQLEPNTAGLAKSRISMAFDPIQQCYVFCTER